MLLYRSLNDIFNFTRDEISAVQKQPFALDLAMRKTRKPLIYFVLKLAINRKNRAV
jgi:hypothetical protein